MKLLIILCACATFVFFQLLSVIDRITERDCARGITKACEYIK